MMFRKYVDVVGLAQPDPRHYAPFPNNPIMVDENAIKKLTEQPPENIPLIWEHKPDIVLGTVREWYTDPKDQDSLLVFARMDLDTDLGSIIYHEAMNGKRYGFSPGYAYKPVPELGIVLRTRIKDISITADPHYTNSVMEILGSKWTKQGKFSKIHPPFPYLIARNSSLCLRKIHSFQGDLLFFFFSKRKKKSYGNSRRRKGAFVSFLSSDKKKTLITCYF